MTNLNVLPTLNIYYVYFHTDPETNEIVYIGKGSRGRAWHCAESNSRGEAHANWMNALVLDGFTPEAWVTLKETALTEKDAYVLERAYINQHLPKFNSKHDQACKLSSEDLTKIVTLRETGLSYIKIAEQLGYSTMTIYRAYNGQTKNYV